MFKWIRTVRDLKYFASLGIPVFLNKDGEVCLKRESGDNPDPVIIVSVPKSGTYLFAEVLSAIGVQRLDLHIDTQGFMDLRYCTQEFAVGHDLETYVKVPCERVLPIVRPGQFLVSHFPCTPEIAGQLSRFKIIFTCRDLRDVLVSVLRYVAKQRKVGKKEEEGWEQLPDSPARMEQFIDKHGEFYLTFFKKLRNWAVQPGVLSVSFEEIQGDYGVFRQRQSLGRIVEFLGLKRTVSELNQILQKSLGKETLTFSGKCSSRELLWSPKVEDFFVQNGGEDLGSFWKTHVEGLQPQKCVG